jgi:hypothetical protein
LQSHSTVKFRGNKPNKLVSITYKDKDYTYEGVIQLNTGSIRGFLPECPPKLSGATTCVILPIFVSPEFLQMLDIINDRMVQGWKNSRV